MRAKRQYVFADGKRLTLGERTLIMGILNITPDSFSDGGKFNNRDAALRHMEEMVTAGADIIDVGAESSRPGFKPMPAQEEMDRLLPLLEEILRHCPVPVSVDTFKAETARAGSTEPAMMPNMVPEAQKGEEMAKAPKVYQGFRGPL
jgi:dihydropteroate synthase